MKEISNLDDSGIRAVEIIEMDSSLNLEPVEVGMKARRQSAEKANVAVRTFMN